MSHLCVYHGSNTLQPHKLLNHYDDIASELASIGIYFSRWQTGKQLDAGSSGQHILAAYHDDIAAFMQQHDYAQADIFSTDEQQEQDCKLLMQEHTHSGDVSCFLVAGRALFGLQHEDQVYLLLCEKGDLVSVPAGVKHWFDLGDQPRLNMIRLYNNTQDLLVQPTGRDIASSYPSLADML